MTQQGGYGIEDIYRGVVNDVIIQVREAFLDEGVDVDVLQQLKKCWETKVGASGAVDLEVNSSSSSSKNIQSQQPLAQQQIPPPALRQPTGTNRQLPQTQQYARATSATIFPATNTGLVANIQTSSSEQQQTTPNHPSQPVNQQQILFSQQQRLTVSAAASKQIHQPQQQTIPPDLGILQQPQQQNAVPFLGLPAHLLGIASGANSQLQQTGLPFPPGTQYTIMDNSGGTQNLILLAAAASGQMNSLANMEQHGQQPGQFIGQQNIRNVATTTIRSGGTASQLRPTTTAMKIEPSGGHVPQLDGGGAGGSGSKKPERQRTDQMGKNQKLKDLKVTQLDGGGGKAPPGMTDESSEEEDREDEEDPTLSAIKYGLEEDQNEGEAEEEEPLNSGDDQSDDEDLETLFDADNVVVCQFEKVHRARNKWKFTLKDGVMHIRGKDFCFQKCTGEAEW